MSKKNDLLVEAAEVLDDLFTWANMMGGFGAGVWQRAETLKLKIEHALANTDEVWVPWRGGEMPVPSGTPIDVRYRDESEETGVEAGGPFANDWYHDGSNDDIVAYRVLKED